MENILIMGVSEAHHKSKSSVLADEIWCYKNPNQTVDYQDGEYKSWLHSIPCFLDVVIEAGLGDLEVIFELPTPLGGYIDIALIGSSLKAACVESGRVLIVELKQWSRMIPTTDKDYVQIPLGHNNSDVRNILYHKYANMRPICAKIIRAFIVMGRCA